MRRAAWIALLGTCSLACGGAAVPPPAPVAARTPAGDAPAAVAEAPDPTPASDDAPSAEAPSAEAPAPDTATPDTAPTDTASPSIATVALPAGDARGVQSLPDHARAHLGNVLRAAHHARVRLVDTIFLVAPDGSARALALYEYSLWEACVSERGGGQDARHACAEQLNEDFAVETGDAGRTCTGLGLARMDFAPPPPGATEATGHTALDDVDLSGECRLERENELSLRDVEGDGATEIVLDVTLARPSYHFRGSSGRGRDTRTRLWIVLREDDMQEQGRVTRFRYDDNDDVTWHGSLVSRLELRDTDGDGRLDLVIDSMDFAREDPPCPVDETGAWTGACPAGQPQHVVRRFSRAHDVWIDPDSP